ncbi:MAG: efflux RND transporter periplasmic adaptor subunit [Sinobacteraceae bacterium]|nr:efflux RND transporter periplasmic adaptor subunit [Nevskiaceae bacterium]
MCAVTAQLRRTGSYAWAAMVLSACTHHAPPPAPPPPKVTVVTVQAQAVPITTELPGRISAYRGADVRPQVSGIILKRLFVEGGDVKAGQQLYQIDPAPYQAAYDSAVAAAASAKSLAERYKPLAEANAVSKQDYDNAVASNLQAKANVETARINLIYTKVLAPISGRIGRTLVTEGQLVTANQSAALASVQQLDPVYVDVTQPSTTLLRLRREAEAGLLKQNEQGKTQVRLKLEDGTDYGKTGTLEFSEVTVDQGTGSVTLRALMPNPDRLLLPGMFVREQIEEGSRQDAVLVPQQGISHNQKGDATALVVGADNTVELRTLQTDRAVGDKWLVTDGIKPGDRVVVEGLQAAHPGSKVQPEEATSMADEKSVRQADSTDQPAATK